ncbi:hypothetical protein MWU78_02065 [Arenibacter sp. F26102]|uniref:hypothetical protein n=1 Tax=Arenibacter sp. F26102 TaxID=2926416 RepID=UPI001FF10288|nr:hypothetical protein [Arenibacter sp. F26102]MCK0144432.1 hypothetical protein [Arenibacter sp. F26102]
MNTSMWIVSALLVLCTVLPFVILNKSGKGDLKIMSNEIKKLMNESKLKFNLKESWGNSFIGLDSDNKALIFSKVFDGVVALENINLNDVLNAKIVKKTHVAKTQNKKETVLERMDLEIKFLDESREVKILNFYDIESIYIEDYELRRAEKWIAAINGAVATSLNRAKVA